MFSAVLSWLGRLLIGFFGLGFVLLLLWAVVVVPPLLIDTSGIQDPAKRLDEINSLRTTLAGVLGGLAVAAGAVVAALNFRETSRQNRAVLELQRRGQVTERFSKAIEQIGQQGPEKLDVRIGAVYALDQIARDSTELHWPIMEVLTAYLRQHAPAPIAHDTGDQPISPRRPPADHQAIATVLGRRHTAQDAAGQALNLQRTDLRWTDLADATLAKANLSAADMAGTNLTGADLAGASLAGAILLSGRLIGVNLAGADLRGANLAGADLTGANLAGANLAEANLAEATLDWADLGGVDPIRLTDVRMMADLREAKGMQARQFASTRGVGLLPPDLLGPVIPDAVPEGPDATAEALRKAVHDEHLRRPP